MRPFLVVKLIVVLNAANGGQSILFGGWFLQSIGSSAKPITRLLGLKSRRRFTKLEKNRRTLPSDLPRH
jgi:hypothetical protein